MCSDLAMIHDSGGPRRVKPILEKLGRSVWDKNRVAVVTDHYVPIEGEETRAIQELTREWVLEQDIKNFMTSKASVMLSYLKGVTSAGMFCVGGDSHSPTGGALEHTCLA